MSDGWTKASEDTVIPPATAQNKIPKRAATVGADVHTSLPPARQPAEVAPGRGGREPKHRLGATLRIPGGFTGRIVAVYRSYGEAKADPDVLAAGGLERVLRGTQGTGIPTTTDQPFYRCTSNRVDYDLVVGELDAHLISQGPDVG